MARCKKDADSIGPIIQLIGFGILLCLISPQTRQIIFGIGVLAAWFVGVVAIGLIGLGIYKRVARKQGPSSHDAFVMSAHVPETITPTPPRTPTLVKSKTTPLMTNDLLEALRSIDWFQFEKVVELLYRKRGYTVTRRGGANPDGGIDLVIEKDGQRMAMQCKHWKTWKIGVQPVREFLGALTDSRIQKGVFITLSSYSDDAARLAEKHGIDILDGDDLLSMFEDINGGSDSEVLAILRDTRKICPKCEREMVLRTAGKGRGMGQKFWGCSRYPRCKFTMPIAKTKGRPAKKLLHSQGKLY